MPSIITPQLPTPVIKTLKPREDTPTPRSDEFEKHLRGASEKPAQPAANTDEKKPEAKKAGKPEKPEKGNKSEKPNKAKAGQKDEEQAEPVDESAEQSETEAQTAPNQSTAIAELETDPETTEAKPRQATDAKPDEKSVADLPVATQAITAQAVQPIKQPTDEKQKKQDENSSDQSPEESDSVQATDLQVKSATNANAATGANEHTDQTDAPTQAAAPEKAEEKGPLKIPVSPLGDETVALPQSKSKAPTTAKATPTDGDTDIDLAATAAAQLADLPAPSHTDSRSSKDDQTTDTTKLAIQAASPDLSAPKTQTPAAKAIDAAPQPPEAQFAESNHDKIVTGVRTQLLPHGGSMQIRLDPPELGALKVMVEMRDGIMNATFQTSNEQATQLLSHSLNQLKHVLETQGVSVERLQVQQAPKSEHSSTGDEGQQQQRDASEDHAARQEQQRKEMLKRMWRRVNGAGDPVDFLA